MGAPRSVILITVDSLRADRCGFLGFERDITPAIDRLASDGLVFENAIAPAGSTRGSATACLSGSYPFDRPGVETRGESIRRHLRARETLPERFRRKGYDTAAFTANPWTSRYFGFDAHFDAFEDFMDDTLSNRYRTDRPSGSATGAATRLVDWWRGQEMFMSWRSYYDDIIEWLDGATQPYFLWIFLVDVHMPYLPPSDFRRGSRLSTYAANTWLFAGASAPPRRIFRDHLLRAYEDTVRYTDRFVSRLVGDVRGDPIVCVHADHGELFGEAGRYGHGYLHEAVIHVPLVIGNVAPERVCRPVSLRRLPDLLTGLSAGRRPPVERPYAIAQNNAGMRVVRGINWRYERLPDDRSLWIRTDGEWRSTTASPLATIAEDVVAARDQSAREQRAIVQAIEQSM